ncbi:MAG: SNF2 helicase associated domain-containing protein [Planctomycetes bacterium]|nr:SNF2 helicase associated domain-containing protein [Planctomycetota bacterium]
MVLNTRSIQAWTTPATYALGARDLREGRVAGLRRAAEGLWSGQVRTAKDRAFNVEVDLGPRGEHFCEGPCEGVCRHIVAVALAVADKGGEATGGALSHWEERLGALTAACAHDAPAAAGLRVALRAEDGRLHVECARDAERLDPRAADPDAFPNDERRFIDTLALALEDATRVKPDGVDAVLRAARELGDGHGVGERFLAWKFRLGKREGGGLRLMGALHEGDLPLSGWTILGERRPWATDGQQWRPVSGLRDAAAAAGLLKAPLEIPAAAADKFVKQHFSRLAEPGALVVEEGALSKRLEPAKPRPVLALSEDAGALVARLTFAYGDGPAQVHEAEKAGMVEGIDPQGAFWSRRAPAAEKELRAQLAAAAGCAGEPWSVRLWGEAALRFLSEGLPGLGWPVVGRDGLRGYRLRGGRAKTSVRVVTSGSWLDIEGQAALDGLGIPLDELFAASTQGLRFLKLPDGSWTPMPEGDLRKLRAVWEDARAAGAQVVKGRIRLPANQRGLVEDIALAADAATGVPEPPRPAPFRPPGGLNAVLRPYQQEGVAWLQSIRDGGFHAILADDMGLGKTLETLTLLLADRERGGSGPNLIVAPTSVVGNWAREAARFSPGFRVLRYEAGDRSKLLPRIPEHDLVLTTYGVLRRDAENLAAIPFRYAILDEAQQIKTSDSQTARAARQIRAEHRLCLSGTPIENNLYELWSQFRFLMPGLLGSEESFRERYGLPIHKSGDAEAMASLRRRVRPFILRRLKEEVARDLPPKTETLLHCELSPAHREFYERLLLLTREKVMKAIDRDGLDGARFAVLEALLRLRQAALHTALVKLPGQRLSLSAKLDEFDDMARDLAAGGHRALVFSQFTEFLALVRARLDAAGHKFCYLDGATRKRDDEIARFQSGDAPFFLISLKAGGAGLNLTGADYVCHLDPWWNPAAEEQATDRAHRIGQTRPVMVYKFVSKDTIEEKVIALQEKKRALAEGVLGSEEAFVRRLTEADLSELLSERSVVQIRSPGEDS